MKHFDAIVIGGGLLGCFTARNLRRWDISVLLLEEQGDVCMGISRANSAIVYPGYDNKPGSLKAAMTVRGNASFDALCEELEVPFTRCGSLMVSFGPKGDQTLKKKLEQGNANGVPGLRLLTSEEARQLEPMLPDTVTAALYAPTTGTVNPWQLGIAAYESAVNNGCQSLMNTKVLAIRREGEKYLVDTNRQTFSCSTLINCAGANADQLQQFLFPVSIQLRLDGTDFLVMNARAESPSHVIFQESEDGKGITAVPCVEGNLLLDSPARPLGVPYATTREGMDFIREAAGKVLPSLDMTQVIRSFGAVRPNPKRSDGKNLPDFCIEEPAPGYLGFVGIKTPGLTCANELGLYAAEKCAAWLHAPENPDFNPNRKAISREDGEILCRCGKITKGAVLEAIARGATTLDGVKHRVGTGMGPCQGSRCSRAIEKLLEEACHGAL